MPSVPQPPLVHAPDRPVEGAAPVASSAVAPLSRGTAVGQEGAQVTAVVPASSGTPGGPTTTVGVPTAGGAPQRPGELARTGADVVLLVAVALLAVVLGAHLLRLTAVRPR